MRRLAFSLLTVLAARRLCRRAAKDVARRRVRRSWSRTAPYHAPPPGFPNFVDHSIGREEISIQAMRLVGIPYRWGGNTPDSGFDCSGLVRYVVSRAASVNLPRTTADMSGARRIDRTGRNCAGRSDFLQYHRTRAFARRHLCRQAALRQRAVDGRHRAARLSDQSVLGQALRRYSSGRGAARPRRRRRSIRRAIRRAAPHAERDSAGGEAAAAVVAAQAATGRTRAARELRGAASRCGLRLWPQVQQRACGQAQQRRWRWITTIRRLRSGQRTAPRPPHRPIRSNRRRPG